MDPILDDIGIFPLTVVVDAYRGDMWSALGKGKLVNFVCRLLGAFPDWKKFLKDLIHPIPAVKLFKYLPICSGTQNCEFSLVY